MTLASGEQLPVTLTVRPEQQPHAATTTLDTDTLNDIILFYFIFTLFFLGGGGRGRRQASAHCRAYQGA